MCICCCESDISDIQDLKVLYCCPLVTSIPSTFVNLTSLYCRDCMLLTSIPDTLVNLELLDCSYCPLLTSIPSTFVNLFFLDCGDCPLLTSIPSTFVSASTWVIDDNSPWINKKSKDDNMGKLITLQLFVKKYVKYRIFSNWIKSREGVEWIYHPDNIGGKMAKRDIEKFITKNDNNKNLLLKEN
jgi:hypothetical protein